MANISLGNTITTGLVLTGDVTGNLVFTSTGGYIDASSVTGAIVVPVGNTAQRPATVANGALRYSTTTSSFEGYAAGAWGAIGGSSAGGPTWQNVITSNTTVSVGNAYPVNTTSSSIYVTLPSSPSAGNSIIITDYARTWSTNNVILNPNGKNVQASNANVVLSTNGQSVNLVYIDSTQGWLVYASGSAIGPYSVDYLVVGGGGSGGRDDGGGGGAGGYISGSTTVTPGVGYSLVIGAGASGISSGGDGSQGTSSSGFSQTAIGGGKGGGNNGTTANGGSGGSGGGGGNGGGGAGGAGTSGQGSNGGAGYQPAFYGGGGGGGAAAVGSGGGSTVAGPGGAGSNWQSHGTYYAGGGGGGIISGYTAGTGGTGGGGAGGVGSANATAGTTNTGGGGGGGAQASSGSGGSGVVIVRYLGSQRGSGGTITSTGGYTYHTFSSSGTFTA